MMLNNRGRKAWVALILMAIFIGNIASGIFALAESKVPAGADDAEPYWLDEIGGTVILEDPAYIMSADDETADNSTGNGSNAGATNADVIETDATGTDTDDASADNQTSDETETESGETDTEPGGTSDTPSDTPSDTQTDTQTDTPTDNPTEPPDDTSEQSGEPASDLEAIFDVDIKTPSGWRNSSSASVRIKITPSSERLWHMVRYRFGSDDWKGIAQSAFVLYEDYYYTDVEIFDNGKMTVRLFGDEENYFDTVKDIRIFDRKPPSVTAGFRELILHVEATDDLSGVAGIQVNSLLFTTLIDGMLDICMDESLSGYKRLAIRAYDYAGNFSEPVTLDNPYYVEPTPAPTATPKPVSKPTAKPTKKPSRSSGSNGSNAATPTPTVTETPVPTELPAQQPEYIYITPDPSMLGYMQPVATAEPETVYVPLGPGQPYKREGNMQTLDMLYSAATNKQFITVQTRTGETYYLIIDYDKPIDEDNDIYETYFLNLVDNRDLMSVVSEDEITPTPTPQIVYVTPEPTQAPQQPAPVVIEDNEDSDNKASSLLLVLGLAAVGGAVFWFIKSRKNKNAANATDLDEYEFDDDDDSDDN